MLTAITHMADRIYLSLIRDMKGYCIMQELQVSQSAYLGRQMEVIAAFSIGANASSGNSTAQSPFAVGLQLDTGNGTYTRVSINGTAAALQAGNLQIMQVAIQPCGHDCTWPCMQCS